MNFVCFVPECACSLKNVIHFKIRAMSNLLCDRVKILTSIVGKYL